MRWTDTRDIVESLLEAYPDFDVQNVVFTKLKDMIVRLPGFTGAPGECNERVLEAVQALWLEEIE